jgi:rod shape determining protein RodA
MSLYNNTGYSGGHHSSSLFGRVDLVALGLYFALVICGIVSITSASYDIDVENVFSLSNNYMKQIMWLGIASVVGVVILLLERRYFHMFAYPAYILGILLLLALFIPGLGKKINGATAWFEIGSIRVQPVEFVKIATALMMARVMSDYSFSMNRIRDLVKVALVIFIPIIIIVTQNDTGSALVLCSFLFVCVREGLTKYLYFPVLFSIFLFIASFIFTHGAIFFFLLIAFMLYSIFKTGEVVTHVRILAAMLLATLLLSIATPLSGYVSLMIVCGITAVILGVVAIKMRAMVLLWPIILFVYAMILVPTCDALFSNLKSHQQDRILTYVGVKSDPKGIDYNVNQSLIAIGSGGMWGKGFLEGTQTKYDYLPEKHTDFIFCTVGEEWGFFGTTIVVILYISLILRLMLMGERIKEPFGRVYCYAVAAILLFHVWVNIGMTIGLMPVMGIPLPLMSYGGSSLVAMTILIMIAIRLDASTEDESVYFG